VIVTLGVDEVPTGKPLGVRVSGELTLAVCQLEGSYYAFDGKCPHRGAQLAEGEIAGGLIVCPLHHFKFSLKTGRCLMPRHLRLRSYPVVREGAQLTIEIKDAAAPAAADTAPAETQDPTRSA
jgi:nitrite reductase/ring-hydroxylating ferredoxin subunit